MSNSQDRTTFYVYAHYRKCPLDNPDERPYYIGKGEKKRAWIVKGRTGAHKAIIDECGLWVKLLSENLTELDALKQEHEFIHQHQNLINQTTYLRPPTTARSSIKKKRTKNELEQCSLNNNRLKSLRIVAEAFDSQTNLCKHFDIERSTLFHWLKQEAPISQLVHLACRGIIQEFKLPRANWLFSLYENEPPKVFSEWMHQERPHRHQVIATSRAHEVHEILAYSFRAPLMGASYWDSIPEPHSGAKVGASDEEAIAELEAKLKADGYICIHRY